MAENKMVGIAIALAVAVLMGVILINVIATETQSKTQLVGYADIVSIAPLRTVGGAINDTDVAANRLYASRILSHPTSAYGKNAISDCAISTIVLQNSTGATWTDGVQYAWVADGNGVDGYLRIINSVVTNNSVSNRTTLTYQTCPDAYVAGWGRTIMNLIPGFFALAILIGAAFAIFHILKEEGVELNI